MTFKPTLDWATAQQRAIVLQKIRAFFLERNILEVDTPCLSHSTITDVYIETFSCDYKFDLSKYNEPTLFLQTSPEFAMKRLLASGYGDIFQICKAFRHEECGRFHNAEFTILEWYRLSFDHLRLMKEVAELLVFILDCQKPEQITYQQLFVDHINVDPLSTSKQELIAVLKKHNKCSDWLILEDNIDILLQVILSEIIEPKIGQQKPCFIYNFPSSQASLAKLSSTDNRVAERFECYFRGIELVNGFNELTDHQEQLKRFKQDNLLRTQKGLNIRPIDYNFIAALESGLPACAGVALGVDRLVMLACNKQHIADVISFSTIST